MKILEYLYFRMYKAYLDKNDDPKVRSFMYISLLQLVIAASFIVYLEKTLAICSVFSVEYLSKIKHSYVFWGMIIIPILLFSYASLARRPFAYYSEKFSMCIANKYIKIWMLVILPFLFLFFSIQLYIFLFGGNILGTEIEGIIS
ncbi:hypothetical protein [Sphingobacterium sp. WOUb80]|uniref:hypothetical protein n=1 Tax=Sphingobacterium sp. WOUb80 TaxID=3234028 RepID=UPI003CE6C5FC